jgi:hypothetical protein
MTSSSCWIREYLGPDQPKWNGLGYDAPKIAWANDLPDLKSPPYWPPDVRNWAKRHHLEPEWVDNCCFEVCCTPDQLRDFLQMACRSDGPKFAPLMDRIRDNQLYILGTEEF